MFITKKVFDPSLSGKAVLISGVDVEGDTFKNNVFLIGSVDGEYLVLVDKVGHSMKLHMENFIKSEGDEWEPLNLMVLEPPQMEPKTLKELIDEDLKKRPQVKKKKRVLRRRTEKEITNDSAIVQAILKRHIGPMQLQDILKAVNEAGCNWYERSATGHMYKAMEIYPTIKRTGFGLYEYVQ